MLQFASVDDRLLLDTHASRLKRMRRAVLTSCRLHSEGRAGFRDHAILVTLTYADASAWSPEDVSGFVRRVRAWCERRGCGFRYVWCLELQTRGAPHYHLMVWLPRGLWLPKPDKRGWWKLGSTRVELARKAGGYLAKYLSKGEESGVGFPEGARCHGCGGLEVAQRQERAWWLLPSYIRERFAIDDDVIRACGGGFLSRQTGEWVESAWLFSSAGRGYVRLIRAEAVSPRTRAAARSRQSQRRVS